jgi:hypothetical protein
LARGIYWATANGANVINMSLESDSDCDPNVWEDVFDAGINEVRDAINHAWAHNVVLVAAAGNAPGIGPIAPAACPHVISVANTDANDVIAGTSNSGTWVDVAAPGVGIMSTAVPGGNMCARGANTYANCSGTSMSSAFVAGLAALVQSSCRLTDPNAVVNRIFTYADDIPSTGMNWAQGRVNALRSVCFPAPRNLRLGTVGTGSIQFWWDELTPGEIYFQIGHRVTGTSSWTYTSRLTDPTTSTHTWTHTGLTSGTSYDHMVRSCDAVGCSPFSDVLTAIAGYGRLTVGLTGEGKVTSTPVGITCTGDTYPPPDCSHQYPTGTLVRLTATGEMDDKGAIWAFDRREGATCSATQSTVCTFTMGATTVVRAVFKKLSPEP